MSSITRMTNVMLDILEAPFLMSAALMDDLWEDAKSERTSRREWDDKSSAETHESTQAHRKHRRGRSVRAVSHSRKAA
jgi:hypothetical protein